MAHISRNGPCPCGSGVEYERCCGRDRAAVRGREERARVLADVAAYAFESPPMVPLDDRFDTWADGMLGGSIPDLEEAIAELPEPERRRLLEAFEQLYPEALGVAEWAGAEEAETAGAVLVGAMVAGLRDRDAGRLDGSPEALELIESGGELLTEPVEALAFVLDGARLWRFHDGDIAGRELAAIPEWLDDDAVQERFDAVLAEVTSRLYGDWHARRLGRMVRGVAAQLPLAAYPGASAALIEGCARFDAAPELGRRIAARLLVDVLPLGGLDDELLDLAA